jgi:C4-dicarboxylate-specific signal transduction histidine kinase
VNDESRRLREQELAFFGRMGADVSHEMRNVLSIIGEHAGLLGDLIAVSKGGKRFDVEKLKKVSASILRQVEKGTGTMARFSRFAHAADEPTAGCDLAAVGRNTAALLQRRVALTGCRLEMEIPDETVDVGASPFSVQHALFSALEVVLESVESGAAAAIKVIE